MQIKAFMYDIARGMRGDRQFYDQMLRRLSGYGFNMLVLQFEYRFQFPSHPSLGTTDSLTPDDVLALDRTARELGMELVPLMNVASHCEGIGYVEAYRHLVADPDGTTGAVEQLRVGDPAVRKFAAELYEDLFACFSSSYFHIGGDEIRRLSVIYPEKTEDERFSIAMDYLLYVIELVKSKGKTAMIWGDMLLKHPSVIGRIPDDVIICDWAYFSDPMLKGLSNVKSQQLFFDAGKRTLACPGVNGFFGNPVVSVNSTLNIVAFYEDHRAVFGSKAEGVMLCSWETDRGNFFSASWPWIYLQGRLFAGEPADGTAFLREYTRLEWGVDTDELAQWHELNDVQVQKALLFEALTNEAVRKALTAVNHRPYKLLRLFVTDVMRHRNVLPVLRKALSWMTAGVREQLRQLMLRAAAVAESMHDQATDRKEEPFMLLEWNRAMLVIIDLLDGVERAEEHYRRSAQAAAAGQAAAARQSLEQCAEQFAQLALQGKALVRWSELLTEYDNNGLEETWWIGQAVHFVERKAAELQQPLHGGKGLLSFPQFVRAEPGTPFSPSHFKSSRTIEA